jgi:hypothetical protein
VFPEVHAVRAVLTAVPRAVVHAVPRAVLRVVVHAVPRAVPQAVPQAVLRAVLVLLLALPVVLLPGGPAAADTGPWGWPLAGPREVSRPFAPPEHRYASGHRGADLPGAAGAAVLAAGAGRVSYAGLLAGRGVVVVVHGSLRTTYEPVTASVRVGDAVRLGVVLGRLEAGHAGCPLPRACTGACGAARSTSTRSAWSSAGRSGCCPSVRLRLVVPADRERAERSPRPPARASSCCRSGRARSRCR